MTANKDDFSLKNKDDLGSQEGDNLNDLPCREKGINSPESSTQKGSQDDMESHDGDNLNDLPCREEGINSPETSAQKGSQDGMGSKEGENPNDLPCNEEGINSPESTAQQGSLDEMGSHEGDNLNDLPCKEEGINSPETSTQQESQGESSEEDEAVSIDNAPDSLDLTIDKSNGKESEKTSVSSKEIISKSGDSDDEVIYVERKEEIIELSDDEAKECAELIDDLCLPENVINGLKNASAIITSKIRENKLSNQTNHVFVEIPSITWSVPWKAVSGIFKFDHIVTNTDKKVKKTKVGRPPKVFRQKRKSINDSNNKTKMLKIKTRSPKRSINMLDNIKQEKDCGEDESERSLSVLRFNMNKPPDFCEVSRSGRVIKKPSRLTDDLLFNRRQRQWRRKGGSGVVDKSHNEDSFLDATGINVSNFQEPIINSPDSPDQPGPSTNSSPGISECSTENSMDSESCDNWMLGLNSDSEGEDIYIDIIDNEGYNPYDELVSNACQRQMDEIQTLKRLRRIKMYSPLGTELHNYRERERRNHLRVLFCNLIREVMRDEHNQGQSKISKVQILNESIHLIGVLNQKLVYQKSILAGLQQANKYFLNILNKT